MSESRTRKDLNDPLESSGKSSGEMEQEIKRLLHKNNGYINDNDYRKLLTKYKNDNIVDKIIDESRKRYNKMISEMRDLAIRMAQKFRSRSTPAHEILDKMISHKNKHGWSDEQFTRFKREFIAAYNNDDSMYVDHYGHEKNLRSRVSKILGSPYLSDSGVMVKDSDKGIIREIDLMYQNSKSLYKSILLQSYTYEDCSLIAMSGEYNRGKNVAMNHIDPIFACLYLVKFESLEKRTLISNIGEIVKSRVEKNSVMMNEGSNMLYQDMVTDPNDIVCDVDNAWEDIKRKYDVQICLCDEISRLRNGQYYHDKPSELIRKLEICRANLFDNPDVAVSGGEGALLSKFFSVFSFRPTWLATQTIYAINNLALPFGIQPPQSSVAFVNQPQTTLTRVPMLKVELPPLGIGNNQNKQDISLASACEQTIWIRKKDGSMVPKKQIILDSDDMLVFYVNRHVQNVKVKSYINPFQFSNAPVISTYFDRINNHPISPQSRINIQHQDEVFELRSVVIVNETEVKDSNGNSVNISVGTCGMLVQPRNINLGTYDPKYWLYDPYGASIPVNHSEGGYFNNKPITQLDENLFVETDGKNKSFYGLARTSGTLFFYSKVKKNNLSRTLDLL